jgi:hypothetical protein
MRLKSGSNRGKMYSLSDVSKILGIRPTTVARWCAEDRIPGATKECGRWQIPRKFKIILPYNQAVLRRALPICPPLSL